MTPTEIAVWVGIVTGIGGIVGGFLTALKFAGNVGGDKSRWESKLNAVCVDVAELKAHRPFFITKKECEREHAEFKEAISRQIEIQVHNGLGEVKEQLSDINGILCYFMGQMNINPPDNPKRRRRSDASTPVVL
jgi:gas vesicle protein